MCIYCNALDDKYGFYDYYDFNISNLFLWHRKSSEWIFLLTSIEALTSALLFYAQIS